MSDFASNSTTDGGLGIISNIKALKLLEQMGLGPSLEDPQKNAELLQLALDMGAGPTIGAQTGLSPGQIRERAERISGGQFPGGPTPDEVQASRPKRRRQPRRRPQTASFSPGAIVLGLGGLAAAGVAWELMRGSGDDPKSSRGDETS